MLAHEPTKPASEGQAGDARGGHDAPRRGKAVKLRFAVEVVPCRAALCAGGARPGIDI